MPLELLQSNDTRPRHPLTRLDRICVSITGQKPAQMQETSAALLSEFPFQEFRLDYLADVAAAVPSMGAFLTDNPSLLPLATCRPLPSGGCFHGTAKQELEILLLAAETGFPLVDLSLESAQELGPTAVEQLRERGAAVLVSFHDFSGTTALDAVLDGMRPLGPDLGKIVSTAATLSDSLTALQFLQSASVHSPFPLVALAMGEPGLLSRILGPRSGSVFTFGSASDAEATAPGQITGRALADLYRIRDMQPTTRTFGVAGDPIHSSLSPLMLNTAFRSAGLDAVYLPLKTADAEELFRLARELPLEGFSVTMPLKQAILPLLDHVDPIAARIGAVNTVQRTAEGKFHGFNTDAAGIVNPLQQRMDLNGAQVLVLGAGGAARAAVFGCMEAGAQVAICNRTPARAQALAQESGATARHRDALAEQSFDVLINATPAGMGDNPLQSPVEEHELNARIVFDLVYNPLETPLLAMAKAKGADVVPGVEMFVHQGARQFEIWTGQTAPREVMKEAVLRALATSEV